MGAGLEIPAQAGSHTERAERRRLVTALLREKADAVDDHEARLEKLERRVPSDGHGDTLGDGTEGGPATNDTALRNLSLMSDEELDAEATDPARRMRAL